MPGQAGSQRNKVLISMMNRIQEGRRKQAAEAAAAADPSKQLSKFKSGLQLQTLTGQTLSPQDSTAAKSLGFIDVPKDVKEATPRRKSVKELAATRISQQSAGDVPIVGPYPGSALAVADSATVGLKRGGDKKVEPSRTVGGAEAGFAEEFLAAQKAKSANIISIDALKNPTERDIVAGDILTRRQGERAETAQDSLRIAQGLKDLGFENFEEGVEAMREAEKDIDDYFIKFNDPKVIASPGALQKLNRDFIKKYGDSPQVVAAGLDRLRRGNR